MLVAGRQSEGNLRVVTCASQCTLPAACAPRPVMRDLRPGAGRGRGSLTAAMGYFGSAQVEEDAGFDVALLDLGEALVDLGELSGLPDHPGPALPMYRVRRARSLRVPTIEPTTVMPFNTASKIGSLTGERGLRRPGPR